VARETIDTERKTQVQAPSLADEAGEADLTASEAVELAGTAEAATDFLKALAHEGRLMILCHLVERERSVAELEQLLNVRQSTVSQMLARLRQEGLVEARREGKTIYYRLTDERTRPLLELIHDMFCGLPSEG
jgi:ArsR family transcriptional regulator, virulence genes transcriptional regulator